jgi:hypothetical protein
MVLALTCHLDGATTLVASSPQPFVWWWDDTFGQTSDVTPPYEHTFQIGAGVESHEFRGMSPTGGYTTTLDLDTAIGLGPSDTCTVGSTVLKGANVSPGP